MSLGLVVTLIDFYNVTLGQAKNKIICFIILLGIILLCTIGYGIYRIQEIDKFISKVRDPSLFLDLSNNEAYNEFVDGVYKDFVYAENMTRFYLESMTKKSDNNSPGSTYTSYWTLERTSDTVVATNTHVTSCYFSFNGETFFCGDISSRPVYSRSLTIDRDYFSGVMKTTPTGCVASNLDTLTNTENNNFKEYEKELDVRIGTITFCSYEDKLVILNMIVGHNPIRISKNMNIGCASSDCYAEMVQLKTKLQLLDMRVKDKNVPNNGK